MAERIAVIGLGYVGLPLALALSRKHPGTIGFDVDEQRVTALRRQHDWTGETSPEELATSPINFSANENELKIANFFIVCVPTPIDVQKRPDFRPLVDASGTVARALSKGAVVVYESTVYPGATEEICGQILETQSGLRCGADFTLGYSPERINPGDREHTLEKITKIVSGQDHVTLDRIAKVYESIISAGIYRAPSIQVAEAAKVIENTQRDLNIALMNELSLIFDRLGIRTKDVLEAAGTKWNFLKFSPGLVGGHCIGVDPYYLTSKAEAVGYRPEVILAGRRINDNMGTFVASKLLRMLKSCNVAPSQLRVGIFGLAFKEDVRDLRNSRVPDIVAELQAFGIEPLVCDPLIDDSQAHEEYGIKLVPEDQLFGLNGLILAVPHRILIEDIKTIFGRINDGGALLDVKAVIDPKVVPAEIQYWSL